MRGPFKSSFVADANGGVALIFGLIVPCLIGFAGIGVDATYWLMERNKLQSSTDNAAISAAHAVHLAGTNQAVTSEAQKMLRSVYGRDMPGITLTVQFPPQSGPHAGDITAVAILAEREQPVYFGKLFHLSDVKVTARSVARVNSTADACLLALSQTSEKAINVSGSSTVRLNCGIASNSTASDAAYFSGASDTKTTGITSAGDIYQSNGALIDTGDGSMLANAPAVIDPYGPEGRNVKVPTNPKNCKEKQLKINDDTVLSPGRYCGGISINGGTTTFSPGVYIIDGGTFNTNGNAALLGQGVTFVLTGKGNDIADVDLNGGAGVSLQAPTSGSDLAGLLFFQDPAAKDQVKPKESLINGNADLDLQGALYFPGTGVKMSGGMSGNMSCLQIVAATVEITGNSAVTGLCDETSGTEKIQRTTVELVE
ncbi:MAG: hypothetical protein B7Y80_01000 [Hyphomicrobium sp. 32-62-53]|nr:MAG: hypothetical protein B7Z29_14320 [Hyphomicrobium sp. 12-62-95]OYY01919.1 MAG: hypothetical protein B7Y80_01000 [Hyphomicrobium sp. 32-62-53]